MKNLLINIKKSLYNAEREHFLQRDGVKEIFIGLCILTDAIAIFTVFDKLLTEQMALLLVMTVMFACCLDIDPVLLAWLINNRTMDSRLRKNLIIILTVTFGVIFSITFALRIATADMLFSSGQVISVYGGSYIDGTVETASSSGLSAAQIIMAVALGLLPLATSVLTFTLSMDAVSKRKRRHILELKAIELRDKIDQLKVMAEELKADMEFDLTGYDDQRFTTADDLIGDDSALLKITSRRLLTETIASPEAVTFLMEGGYEVNENDNSDGSPDIPSDSQVHTKIFSVN